MPAFALYGYSYVYVGTMLASASVYDYSHAYILYFEAMPAAFKINRNAHLPSSNLNWVGAHFD